MNIKIFIEIILGLFGIALLLDSLLGDQNDTGIKFIIGGTMIAALIAIILN